MERSLLKRCKDGEEEIKCKILVKKLQQLYKTNSAKCFYNLDVNIKYSMILNCAYGYLFDERIRSFFSLNCLKFSKYQRIYYCQQIKFRVTSTLTRMLRRLMMKLPN